MKPAPNVLFPIAEYGGKERSIFKAYNNEKKKFGNVGINIEIAKYRCISGRRYSACPLQQPQIPCKAGANLRQLRQDNR